MYKFCPNCGSPNEGFKFCPECGNTLEKHNENAEGRSEESSELFDLNNKLLFVKEKLSRYFLHRGVGRDWWDDDVEPLDDEMINFQSNLFFTGEEIDLLAELPERYPQYWSGFVLIQSNEIDFAFVEGISSQLGNGFTFYFKELDQVRKDIRLLEETEFLYEENDYVIIYCGEILNGLYHGNGCLYNWEYGVLQYEGEFKNGLFHGHGFYYNVGLDTDEGIYRNGELIELLDHRDADGAWDSEEDELDENEDYEDDEVDEDDDEFEEDDDEEDDDF